MEMNNVTDLEKLSNGQYEIKWENGKAPESNEDRLWEKEIHGEHGKIYPYGYDGSLAVYCSNRKLVSKIRSSGAMLLVKGEQGATFKFQPALFGAIANIINSNSTTPKKQLSPELLEKLRNNIKKAREARAAKKLKSQENQKTQGTVVGNDL